MSSIQEIYTPIRVLNQFSTDWRIKARVTKKEEPRQWRNNKGEGTLMGCELIDKEGTQIQVTFFGEEAAKKFAPLLKENKVFLFANGSVKLANKKYTSIKNDYCLTFDQNADVQEVEEDS
jgi:replication factor A1